LIGTYNLIKDLQQWPKFETKTRNYLGYEANIVKPGRTRVQMS